MNLEDIMQSEVGQSMTFDWSNGLILIDHLAVVFPIVVVVLCIPQVITIHTKRQTTETSQQMTLLCTSIMLLLIVRVIDGQEYLIIIYCERCNLVWSHEMMSYHACQSLFRNLWTNHNNNNNSNDMRYRGKWMWSLIWRRRVEIEQ